MDERLKLLRKELGYTQQQIADILGIKRNTYSQYENGRNKPIDAIISLICDRFHVNEKWLRSGEEPMYIHREDSEYIKESIDKLDNQNIDDNLKLRFISSILKLDNTKLREYITWIKDTFELVGRDSIIYPEVKDPEQIIREKVASYEAELRAEAASEKESASQTGSTGTGSHKAI